jgi:hypothetical protein
MLCGSAGICRPIVNPRFLRFLREFVQFIINYPLPCDNSLAIIEAGRPVLQKPPKKPQFNDHIATHITGFYHKLSTLHYQYQNPLQSSLSDASQRESYGIKNTEANCKNSNWRKNKVVPVHAMKVCRVNEV